MTKYQFKKKTNEPSDEQIRSRMNFNKLLKQHENFKHYRSATRPLYKKPLFLGFMILLGIILLLLIFES